MHIKCLSSPTYWIPHYIKHKFSVNFNFLCVTRPHETLVFSESLRPAASPGHGAVYFSVTSSAPRRTGWSGRSSSSSSFTAMDDTSASAFSTAMDDTYASAFSTAMDDTSASVLMTWTTSARFTDAPGPKVIALTEARYQPHPSFRTALLSSEHARSSPQGSTTAPRRPAANAHASTPPPNPL